MQQNPRVGYALCIITSLIWAGTSPGISLLLNHYGVPALTVAFWRDVFIAVACMTGILLFRPAWLRMSWSDLRGFAVMGTISVGIYHAIFVYSIALNGAALAIVLIYLYPAFVTLGARLFFKETIGPSQVLSLLLAFVGCVLLVHAYDPAVLQVSWLGTLAGIGSAVTHAGYVLFNQRAVTKYSPWVSLALTMTFGALFLLGLVLVVQGPAGLGGVGANGEAWLVLAVLALGPTLGGYLLFTMSLRYIPGRIASVLVILEVPAATLLAVVFLGERMDVVQVVGMGLVILAAMLPAIALRWPRVAAARASA